MTKYEGDSLANISEPTILIPSTGEINGPANQLNDPTKLWRVPAHPGAIGVFIEEFTSHPLVDQVMKRLAQ